jgi:hypothetical protein
MTVPIIRAHEMLHENEGLLIENIYPEILSEYRLREHLHTHEAARNVFFRILILGAVNKGKTIFIYNIK